MDIDVHVGGRVKNLVEKRGIKKTDFASKIGHSEQSLHAIFRKEDISTSLLKTICSGLGITLSDFFQLHGAKRTVEPHAVSEAGAEYGDPCGGLRRENELLRSQVTMLSSNNQALQQVVDVLQGLMRGAQLVMPQGKAHTKSKQGKAHTKSK